MFFIIPTNPRFYFWLILIGSLLLGPLAITLGISVNADRNALIDHGKVAAASIDEVKWKKKRGIERSFSIDVSFSTSDGQEIEKNFSVSNELGKRIRDDDDFHTIEVRYLPENPQTAYLEQEAKEFERGNGVLFTGLIIGLLSLGLAALMIRHVVVSRRRNAAPERIPTVS